MTKAGLFETRNNLSHIIDKVMHGEEHLILRKNVPVAKIIPILENVKIHSQELIKKIEAIRSQAKKVTIDEINEWKKRGRA